MSNYVRLNTFYNVVNLDNVDSRKTGESVSYRNLTGLDCDASGQYFEMFGKFSKFFVCSEHLPYFYKNSSSYVDSGLNQICTKCNYLDNINDFNIDTHRENDFKIINKQVRQSSSRRTDKLKTIAAKDYAGCKPWNNQSSKVQAGLILSNNVPSRGNSTISTITRHRPGAGSAPGLGVDVKHGSYDRYLLKKKYNSLKC